MEVEIEKQQPCVVVKDTSVVVGGGEDDMGEQTPAVEDELGRHAQVDEPRVLVTSGVVGPSVVPLDLSTAVEGNVITGSGFVGASGSGGGVGPSGSLPRDMTKGNGIAVDTKETMEAPTGSVKFRPAAGSSRHKPILKGYFVEYMDDATLARLLQDNPVVVAVVVAAREERQKAIALAQEEERLRDEAESARVEGEDALREMEAARRAKA
ncbi:hypothetical protein RHMOL_Rhmol04G0236900 [Rhododendron molle]|uniref:Uncharacterized protein n=1 Tax=Rhododendron molle TaxID=49168 RepID=A0ACC0P3L7_RHOML|nr:hypothetical protein RHMOL_Rhmol04G0236900 [Rhododendron molle]